MNRVEQLKAVQAEALELFTRKNTDYGDAFAKYGTNAYPRQDSTSYVHHKKQHRLSLRRTTTRHAAGPTQLLGDGADVAKRTREFIIINFLKIYKTIQLGILFTLHILGIWGSH